MSSLVKGAFLTLKSMGLNTVFRETLRRALGISYQYRGIPISSDRVFRLIRGIVLKGYNIYYSGDEVIVCTPFGEFGVDKGDIDLLRPLLEPLEDMYGSVDVRNAVVIDIGALIGETALMFLSRGARRVYALEPVEKHYHYLLKNISRNRVADYIVPLNYGVWFRETHLVLSYEGASTGSKTTKDSSLTIKVKDLGDVLETVFKEEKEIDVVKMDCEGCEYALLTLSADKIRLVKQYVMEIHGSETPIIDKMIECGYRWERLMVLGDLLSIHRFTRDVDN